MRFITCLPRRIDKHLQTRECKAVQRGTVGVYRERKGGREEVREGEREGGRESTGKKERWNDAGGGEGDLAVRWSLLSVSMDAPRRRSSSNTSPCPCDAAT